jgi:hypothetical protein
MEPEHYPLTDAIDHEILMHRDAHFGGLFPVMLNYYVQEGKGIQPEFDVPRIERLILLENQMKQNLAVLFLAAHEAQKVADARASYQRLQDIYEVKNPRSIHPQLIADLILSEEEDPAGEIAAIVAQQGAIVPLLIDLLKTEDFYDPLFPGYGEAPSLVVRCLGLIGDKRAIISLFEALGQGDFFADDLIVKALKEIGLPARDFLLKVVAGRPLNEDNEKAAIALVAFKDDELVSTTCLDLLQQPDIQKNPCLPTYLVLICAGLTNPIKQQAFLALGQNKSLPGVLPDDYKAIQKEWKMTKE